MPAVTRKPLGAHSYITIPQPDRRPPNLTELARLNAEARAGLNERAAARQSQEQANAARVDDLRLEFTDPLSVRALAKRGYDVMDGLLFYQEQALYPSEVVLDPADEPDFDGNFKRSVRSTFRPEYEQAFSKFVTSALSLTEHGTAARTMAMSMLTTHERNALIEGTDAQGGYLVPPSFLAEVQRHRAAASIIRNLARVVPTAGDKLTIPVATPHGSSPNIYSSGFVGGFYNETSGVLLTTDPIFEGFEISLKKIRAATTPSRDLLDDSEALMAFLSASGGENMGLVEDEGFLIGGGFGVQPLGVLLAYPATDTLNVAGTTSHAISNTTSDAGSAPKLLDLQGGLPSQYRKAARWIMRSASETKVRTLVDGAGRFQFPHADTGTLAGDPVEFSDFVPADGVAGNTPILYGDIEAACIVASKPGVSLDILYERYADSGQVGVLLKSRSGIGLLNSAALRVGVV